MNIASIDIGTNTLLMLICKLDATGKLSTITNVYKMPRIGKNLTPGGKFPQSTINKITEILSEYKSIAREHNCSEIIINATNAFRLASNGNRVCDIVKKKLDLTINIIPGEKEAYYSYLGASSVLPEDKLKCMIDIGGGSTEIVLGRKDKILFRHSFVFGVVSLTELYLTGNKNVNLTKLTNHVKNELSAKLPPFELSRAVAVAGTPTTLACLDMKLTEYDENKVEGYILTYDSIKKLRGYIITETPESLLNKYPKILEGRNDLILAGTLILECIAETMGLNNIYASSKGLRYGAVMDYYATSLGKMK